MALDFCILDDLQVPVESLPIDDSVHSLLLSTSPHVQIGMFDRVQDYYEDAEYGPEQVSELRHVVHRLLGANVAGALRDWLIQFETLLTRAESMGRGISVVAD